VFEGINDLLGTQFLLGLMKNRRSGASKSFKTKARILKRFLDICKSRGYKVGYQCAKDTRERFIRLVGGKNVTIERFIIDLVYYFGNGDLVENSEIRDFGREHAMNLLYAGISRKTDLGR
jgi:hypothetical protein